MNSKYFCVLPWFSKESTLNGTTVCCLLPHGYSLETLRKDLLEGRPSDYCTKCWTIENSGHFSRRQQENLFLDYKLDKDIANIEMMCKENLHSEMMYQITLSNLCNQACVTCSDKFSTKWAELSRQFGQPAQKLKKNTVESLNIDYANAKRINILGGEPLFDPQLEVILSNLLAHNNTACFISFVTNGSIKLSPRLLDLISSFSDVNICVSIDGIESRFEYLRWPGKWPELVVNLEQYRKVTNNKVSVSYTISAVNAIYYDETVAWFKSQQLNYNHNIVYQPSWASLQTMPLVIKNVLQHHAFFQPYVQSSLHQSSQMFVEHLKQQDQMKKVCFTQYLPDLAALLGHS